MGLKFFGIISIKSHKIKNKGHSMNTADWIGIIFGILVSVWANKRGYAWWA